MKTPKPDRFGYSVAISVCCHVAIVLLLLGDFAPLSCSSMTPRVVRKQQPDIVHAKAIDSGFLDELEARKQRAERERAAKARAAHERKLREKARRQAELKAEVERKRKEAEERERKEQAVEAERQHKLREQKRKIEKQRARDDELRREKILKEEKNRKETAERKRKQAEEQRRKQAEEQRRKQAEEQRRKQAEEQRRKQAEEQRRKQAEEQRRKQAEEQRRKQAEEDRLREMAEKEAALSRRKRLKAIWGKRYATNIQDHITSQWKRPPPSVRGGDCVVRLRQNKKGEILKIEMLQCEGDKLYVQSVENAIRKANPLPPPPVDEVFEPEIRFTFKRNR